MTINKTIESVPLEGGGAVRVELVSIIEDDDDNFNSVEGTVSNMNTLRVVSVTYFRDNVVSCWSIKHSKASTNYC